MALTKAEKEKKVKSLQKSVAFYQKEVSANKQAIAKLQSYIKERKDSNKKLPVGSGQRSLNLSAIKNLSDDVASVKKSLAKNNTSLKHWKKELAEVKSTKVK